MGAFSLPRRPCCTDRRTQLYGHIATRYTTAERGCTGIDAPYIDSSLSKDVLSPGNRRTDNACKRYCAIYWKHATFDIFSILHRLARESKVRYPRPW